MAPYYQASDPSLQGYHFKLYFKLLQLVIEQTTSTVFDQIQKSKQEASPFSNTDANHSWDENPSLCSTLDRYTAVARLRQ